MPHKITKVERWVLRAPIAQPVANAFGAMTNRPALFLRISADDGAGWGEVFCISQVGGAPRPACGQYLPAAHRCDVERTDDIRALSNDALSDGDSVRRAGPFADHRRHRSGAFHVGTPWGFPVDASRGQARRPCERASVRHACNRTAQRREVLDAAS
jgi:hypothetical protein